MNKFWDAYDRLLVLARCRKAAVMVRDGAKYRIEFGSKPPRGTALLASVWTPRKHLSVGRPAKTS